MKYDYVPDLLFWAASRPARGAWVEITKGELTEGTFLSRPARGAWVEITKGELTEGTFFVAPRKGRVG